jgi:hypothetical protein
MHKSMVEHNFCIQSQFNLARELKFVQTLNHPWTQFPRKYFSSQNESLCCNSDVIDLKNIQKLLDLDNIQQLLDLRTFSN